MRRLLVPLLAGLAIAGCAASHPNQSAGGSVHPAGWGGTPKGYVAPPVTPRLAATPTATMYDAVNVGQIPTHPFAAAGYTAGSWITWPQVRAIAQHAVSIAIQARYHADCLDVEPRDATPSQAGPWAVADIAAGFAHPCLYSDLSEMPAVKASLAAAQGPSWHAHDFLWLAWYRDIPGLVPGYDAVQYWNHCLGRNLDCSTVTLAFLTIAQPPYVAPKPTPQPPAPGRVGHLAFNLGFGRGFTVAWLEHRHRSVPAFNHRVPRGIYRPYFDRGFQDGFRAGWKRA